MIEKLQQTINTIELNLTEKINLQQLALDAGYNYHSYQHLFKDHIGMPMATYISKRRLEKSIYAIQEGMLMTDAALAYGFDTYAGFYKAFSKQYGCSPKKYLALNTVGPTTALDLFKESKKMLTKHEIKRILSHWELTEDELTINNPQKNAEYLINEAYEIGDNYIFKSGKNIPWMMTHVKMTKALKAVGLESPYPIRTKNGEDYVVDGDVYYMLLHKVKGSVLTTEERRHGDAEAIGLEYGHALAKLHLVLKSIEDNMDVIDSDIINTLKNWAIPTSKRNTSQWQMEMPKAFYDEIETKGFELMGSIPRQLIHRDPNPFNIVMENGKVQGFIDFEISESNVRIFDLCYVTTGNLLDLYDQEGGFDRWIDMYKNVVAGYEKIIPLSTDEKKAMPYVIYAIQLIFIAYLDGKNELKDMLRKNREMLHLLWENHDRLNALSN